VTPEEGPNPSIMRSTKSALSVWVGSALTTELVASWQSPHQYEVPKMNA
jgi:hypothetical protein